MGCTVGKSQTLPIKCSHTIGISPCLIHCIVYDAWTYTIRRQNTKGLRTSSELKGCPNALSRSYVKRPWKNLAQPDLDLEMLTHQLKKHPSSKSLQKSHFGTNGIVLSKRLLCLCQPNQPGNLEIAERQNSKGISPHRLTGSQRYLKTASQDLHPAEKSMEQIPLIIRDSPKRATHLRSRTFSKEYVISGSQKNIHRPSQFAPRKCQINEQEDLIEKVISQRPKVSSFSAKLREVLPSKFDSVKNFNTPQSSLQNTKGISLPDISMRAGLKPSNAKEALRLVSKGTGSTMEVDRSSSIKSKKKREVVIKQRPSPEQVGDLDNLFGGISPVMQGSLIESPFIHR